MYVLYNYLVEEYANWGVCVYPRRWKLLCVEEKRPGEYLPIVEDERGAYILNSKDSMYAGNARIYGNWPRQV